MTYCEICHQKIRQDALGTWIDPTEGDVCMDNDGNDVTHTPEVSA